jgi:S1-C subfamily serine protease
MSNSENENRTPGQPEDDRRNAGQPFAGQPFEYESDAGRRAPGGGQFAANQPMSRNEYSGQPMEPMEPLRAPEQSMAGEDTNRTPYVGYGEQNATPIEHPSEIRERGVPPPVPPESSFASSESRYTPPEQPSETRWRERSQAPLYIEGSTQSAGSAVHQSNAGAQPAARPPKKGRANFLVGALTGALLCLLLGGLAGWQIGKHSAASQGSGRMDNENGAMTTEQVIAQDRQAVVQINVKMAKGRGVGSGVIIDSQGHIVTNDHVVSGGQSYNVVLFDGTSLPAKLVGVDTADDLAVIKINSPGKMFVMPIGDSSKLEVGNTVLAIGNPLGITQTVTQGIVSALGRTVSEGHGGGTIVDAVQTDAPINPGNSGGALVAMNGNLIGIPTLVAIDPEFKTPANGVGFAVPSNRVKFIVPQLIQYGKVVHSGRAALQASVTTVDPVVAAQDGFAVNHGVLIVSTVAGGAAARAGLKAGDVLTQINNQAINNASDLSDSLLSYDPGTTITVNYVRGTQQHQTKVKLGELKVS